MNGGALRNQSPTAQFAINASSIIIESGGRIEGNVNITAANLTILSGGMINATGTGFAGSGGTGAGANGDGPADGGGGGAGYGGVGGNGQGSGGTGGSNYGNALAPTGMGSGGGDGNGGTGPGGSGGGAIKINVTNTLIVNGTITADGGIGGIGVSTISGGGGSGGSIYIIANSFQAAGNITAKGGVGLDASTADGGGGAGGRIAVYYKTGPTNLILNVSGGNATPNANAGANGTNFSASLINVQLTLNQTTQVVAGKNLTIYGNFTVSAYNLTNYTISVFVGNLQYFINDSEYALKNITTSNNPKTNDTSGGTNTGGFRYNITIPDSLASGTYTLTVNSSLNIISGTASVNFNIPPPNPPIINRNVTIPTYPQFGRNVTIQANVTDADGNTDIKSVNFTLIAPNGTFLLAYRNGTQDGSTGDFWNSSSVNLTSYGTWLWNVSAFDIDGRIINSTTGQIILMQITESLNATLIPASAPIAVYGHINLSNGSNVSSTNINLFIDNGKINLNNSVIENATNFLSGTTINVTVNANNITLQVNGSNQYPNQSGNFNSQVIDTLTVSNFTFISWTQEVSYQAEIGRCVAKDSLITLANGSKKKIKDIKEGEYVQSLDEKTGKIVANKVNALLDMGNRTVFEVMTESGRAINTTSNHPYLVKLHSKEDCYKYIDDVWNKDYQKNSSSDMNFFVDYCTRWVEVSKLKEGMEVAVPKIKESYSFKNISTNSGVEYTLISPCFLKSFSLDQIAHPSCNASAKYGTSLLCGANFSALDCVAAENLYIGNISILSLRISNASLTSSSPAPQILANVPIFLLNSSIKYGIATNFNLSAKNNSLVLPLPMMAANKTLASTTSSIYLASRNLFATASEILSVNSLASLPETLILDENSLSLLNLSALSNIALVATSDQSSLISLIVFSNSSGTDIVIVPILQSPKENKENGYLNFSENSDITFEKITSIKVLDKQQVYDLEIEGTHNFIANDIIAHNTNADKNPPNLGGINTSGLVLLMHFNNESSQGENNSLVKDWSVDVNGERSASANNNGTLLNGTSINKTNYKFGGGAAQFDGVDDFVGKFPKIISPVGSSRTICLWTSIADPSRRQGLVTTRPFTGVDGGFLFGPDGVANEISYVHIGGSNLAVGTTINANQWYHLCVTLDTASAVATMYKDGLQIGSLASFSVERNTSSNGTIGAEEDGLNAGRLLNGSIDEVAIWNRSLSAQEILNLYKRGALKLNLSVRSCDDSACSGESFSDYFTNSSGIKLNTTITPINRYFQYRFDFNSSGLNLTPVLYNVTINYTNLATDSFGNYNYTFTSPSSTGTYTIKINTSTDTGIPGEQLTALTVDATPPTVNTSINNTSPRRNSVVNLSVNVTDNIALSIGQIIVNDTGAVRFFNFSLSGTADTFSQNITVSCGRGCVINFTARVNDTVNNFRTNDTLITITNTPPDTPVITFPANNMYTSRQPLPLNISGNDVDSDVINISYYINGKLNQTSLFNTTLNASDGTYILNVSAADASSVSANATVNFTIDTKNPAVRLDSPANYTWSTASFTASFTPSDANLGNCTLYHNFTGVWQSNVTVVNAVSGASNSFSAITVNDSLFVWDVSCNDLAGNSAFNGSNFTARIDTASPTAFNLTSPANNTLSSNLTPTFNWNRTIEANFANYTLQISNGSNFETINYTAISAVRTEANATVTVATDKTWFWRAIAFDQAGNNFTSGYFNYTTDTKNPAVRLDSPANYTWSGSAFTASFTPSDANLGNCTLYHNFTGVWQSNVTVVSAVSDSSNSFAAITVNDSLFVWDVSCNDLAGNSAFNGSNFTARIDTASPTAFNLTSPANNTLSNNLTPTFTWNLTVEANFANYTLQVSNGTDFSTINYTAISAARTEANVTVTVATDRTWYWRAIAFDQAVNNFTSGFFRYVTDTTSPSVAILNVTPNPAEFTFDNVTVNWTASDANLNSSIVNVSYPNGSLLSTYTNNFTLTTTNLTVIGNYTITLFANDSAGNFNTASTQLKVRDTTPPSAFGLLTPADGTRSNVLNPTLTWQDTVEPDFNNYTIDLSSSNSFSFVNFSYKAGGNASNSSFTVTTALTPGINWTWRVTAYDKSNNSRLSLNQFRYETFVNTPPTVPNLTSPANNTEQIYNNINFTWNASTDADNDNINYELIVAKDTSFTQVDLNVTGIGATYYSLLQNASALSRGVRYWRVRAYDGANFSDYSAYMQLRSIVAILNITSPLNNSVFYPGNTTAITINVLNGSDWVNNSFVTLNGTNYTLSNSSGGWTVNLTFPQLTARYLNITAYAYNSTANLTATAYITVLLSKVNSSPAIDYVCANETYSRNGSNITIKLKASLDTLINASNVSLTLPSGIVSNLTQNSFMDQDLVYTYGFNYTINETGNYTLTATVRDIENKTAAKNFTFFAASGAKSVNVSGFNITSIKIRDICSNDVISNGTQLSVTLAENALSKVEIITAKPTIVISNANLTNTTKLLNYTDIEKNISAPSGKRIVTEFEIKTNLSQFDSINVSYNYSSLESALDNENNLAMYKCPTQADCISNGWNLLNTTLDNKANVISASVSSLSVFLVAETATTTTTTTTTVTNTVTVSTPSSGGGGGGGISTVEVPKIVKLEMLMPHALSIYLNDSLTVPIIIRNSGEVGIQNISLDTNITSQYLTVWLNNTYIKKLGVNEIATVNAIFTSFANQSGKTEATFTANGKYPLVTAQGRIYIDVIDRLKENKSVFSEKIKFLADLFNNNPECLELNELLKQAEESSKKGEFEKSRTLTETAISSCRQLLSYKAKRIVAEKPKSAVKLKLNVPLIIALVLIILALLSYYFGKKGSLNRLRIRFPKKSRKERRLGPTRSEEEEIRRLFKKRKI